MELGNAPEKVAELKAAIEREHKLAQEEYRSVETKIEIPHEVINQWLDPYRALPIRECLLLLSSDPNILPSYDAAYAQAVDEAKQFVFLNIAPVRIQTDEMTVKRIDDEDGKLAYGAARNFRMRYLFAATFFIPHLFELLKSNDPDYLGVVRQHIAESDIIDECRLALITAGLEAFNRDDHIACIHILLPQIEGALRDFLGCLGMPKTNFLGLGDWEAQTLNRILDILADIEGFDSDFVWLIRLLLADKLGDNLRNEAAHGIAKPEKFNWRNAASLLFIIVKLTAYRFLPAHPIPE